eukprot:TRINITY_DN14476_c0_g1_i2.p2 TRINITY_DN14476_c0_g1~~TRINITY_DN14476_c0_g1_i2.p2  ORF type:complete len:205 (-),score=72.18 TRINITY_DN14476_c0_g1_i2:418-1032(-)
MRSYPGSGTQLFDLSGGSRHVTFSSAPVYNSGTGSFSFATVIRNSFSAPAIAGLAGWSVQIFFRTPSTILATGDQYVLSPALPAATCGTANCLHVVIRDQKFFFGTWSNDCVTTQVAQANTDYLFTGVYSSGTMYVYVNSKQLTTTCTSKVAYTGSNPLELGSYNGATPWNGLFYSAKIYSVALDATAINKNIQAHKDVGKYNL